MGLMSLKAEDCIGDYSGLDEKQVRAAEEPIRNAQSLANGI
jgi:hypothetical protein